MVTGYYPTTIEEALSVRAEKKSALLVTGGTDVMVVKKTADDIIFLNNVKEMQEVVEHQSFLSIGAACVYTDLINNDLVPEILKMAMRKIASPAIRSAGSLAGNICNASPAGDSLPVLYALDAVIVAAKVTEANGEILERRIPISDFILGIRKIDLAEDEIVIAIEIPKASYEKLDKVYYEKVGARKSEAISKLSFIGAYSLVDGKISDVKIAFGSVGITVLRFKEIEAKLLGKNLKEVDFMKDEIVDEYMSHIHPIDDQRSTAEYRCSVCRNLLGDFLTD